MKRENFLPHWVSPLGSLEADLESGFRILVLHEKLGGGQRGVGEAPLKHHGGLAVSAGDRSGNDL